MSTPPEPTAAEPSAVSSDHLTVRPEGVGPGEVMFTFQQRQQRLGGAVGASIAAHIGIALLLVLIARLLPDRVYEAVLPDRLPDLIWVAQPGPGGGGGGGGNSAPEPPKKVELQAPKVVAPPIEKPVVEAPKPPEPETPIPAQTPTAPPVSLPGALEATQASTESQGTGVGGGGGTGRGTGVGQGEGSGLGAGTGGGVGGGVYRPGNGVVSPRLLREVRPAYTAEAMRARIQGTVIVECVVLPDGTVGRVEVIKSLDSTFGLDQEAIKAAKQWRFAPGTRFGEPVAVLISIELAFTVR